MSVMVSRLVTMLQLMFIAVGTLAGLGQATPVDHGKVKSILSLNISTAEGDRFLVDVESKGTNGNEIVHSTMNDNSSQTVVTNHTLGIRVIIPDLESEDCHFTELSEEENTEHMLEEEEEEEVEEEDPDDVDATEDTDLLPTTNATAEKACLYDEDEPDMTEEVRTAVESMCGTRRIRHLTKMADCKDIPQGKDQQDENSDETESGELVRRKRWLWWRSRCQCFWISRRVTRCVNRRGFWFRRRRRYCFSFWHTYHFCWGFCWG